MSRPLRICITSPWNYPLFNPECATHFGGWEVRIALIAKELARRGDLEISLVVADHGQPHVELRDGVRLYSWSGRTIWGVPARDPGPRGELPAPGLLRRLSASLADGVSRLRSGGKHPGPLSGQVGPYEITAEMVSVYDEVSADIHVVPGNSQFSAEAAFFCRQRGKKYVFLAGSDFDYFPEYRQDPGGVDMYSVPHALKNYSIEAADVHIVQNERQALLLREGYGRSSVVIRNPMDLTRQFPRNSAAVSVLWVGKSDERIKRPSLVLELARQMPDHRFAVIMTYSMAETHARCIDEAGRLPNVSLIERVPFSQVESYFADARAHLNTSVFEGFPNTFLQAAKYGVPTISLQVDPGDMLSEHGCGVCCGGDFGKLKESLRAVLEDDGICSRLGRAALEYVRICHDKDVIVPRYEEVFRSLDQRAGRTSIQEKGQAGECGA